MDTVQEETYEPTQAEVDAYIDQLERQNKNDSDPESRQRIKKWMAACLISVAGLTDFIQFLLTLVAVGAFLSPVISIGANFLFWLWFNLLGVSFFVNPRRFFVLLVQCLVEIIPVLDVLPATTAGVTILVLLTITEDRGGVLGKIAGATTSLAKGKYKKFNKKMLYAPTDAGNGTYRYKKAHILDKPEEFKKFAGKDVFKITREDILEEATSRPKTKANNGPK